jgi:hypothetical protein
MRVGAAERERRCANFDLMLNVRIRFRQSAIRTATSTAPATRPNDRKAETVKDCFEDADEKSFENLKNVIWDLPS